MIGGTIIEDLEAKVNDLENLSDEEIVALLEDCEAGLKYYKSMNLTVKLGANAAYGACAASGFRFYNHEVAHDITNEGKLSLFAVDDGLNKYFKNWHNDSDIREKLKAKFGEHLDPNPVKTDICNYGDTDSRYINYGEIFKSCGFKPKNAQEVVDFILWLHEERISKINKMILEKFATDNYGEPGNLKLMLETIGGKGIFISKKHYIISLFYKDGKYVADKNLIKAIGVELVQGSTSKFVKESMKKVLYKLLTPNTKITDVFKIGSMIAERAKHVPLYDMCKGNNISDYSKYVISDTDKLIFNRVTTVKNGKKHTTSVPIHVRAAANYNHHLYKEGALDRFDRIKSGDKIHWYYTEDDNVFGVPDDVMPEKIPNYPKPDLSTQVDKLIIRPLKRFIFSDEIDASMFGQQHIQAAFKRSS